MRAPVLRQWMAFHRGRSGGRLSVRRASKDDSKRTPFCRLSFPATRVVLDHVPFGAFHRVSTGSLPDASHYVRKEAFDDPAWLTAGVSSAVSSTA